MTDYIGLDVSMKETAISVRREGKRVWRGKCASDPAAIAELIRMRAPNAERVVFETGPLSVWFYHALRAEGLPAIASMLVTPKRRSTWPPTKPMPTTPMGSRT
ncbi:hypothetical protein GCM10007937_14380 [Mesorhizobium albiziae]|nr:hypothetical protein GCM10007937_14380 [Mesorhizobium albiziae]